MQCRSEHDQWEQCLNVWGTVCAAVEVLHGAKISQTTYMMDASWKRGRINGPVLYRLYGPCRSLMTLVRCWSLTILTPTYTNPHRNLGLCLDFQPKSVFWHIKIVFRLIWGNLDSEKTCEMRFFANHQNMWFKLDFYWCVSVWLPWTFKLDFKVSFVSLAAQHTMTLSKLERRMCFGAAEQNPWCY